MIYEDTCLPQKCANSETISAVPELKNQYELDKNLARQLQSDWENLNNKEWVTEVLPDMLPVSDVVVIDDG